MYLFTFIFGPLNPTVTVDTWNYIHFMPIPAPEWENFLPYELKCNKILANFLASKSLKTL